MSRYRLELDLLTQQFIVHRWRTTQGREIRDKVIQGLHDGNDINDILTPYILVHPANAESHEYPYYPPDAINSKDFWVLASDDLRGIQFYDEDFSDSTLFSKLNLSYATFSQCILSKLTLEFIDLSYATIDQCDCADTIFSHLESVNTKFINSKLKGAILINSYFAHTIFSNTDLRHTYFEETKLRKISLDYQTKLDKKLRTQWHDRRLPNKQLPDLYRAIRLAYENAELYVHADYYLMRELVAYRKYLIWPRLCKQFNFHHSRLWLTSLVWAILTGYGVKPLRTIFVGMIISLLFSIVYYVSGVPETHSNSSAMMSALYLSFTTYSTLGYGDLTYLSTHPWMRLLTTSEAWIGAVMIALFVVVLARKLIRR